MKGKTKKDYRKGRDKEYTKDAENTNTKDLSAVTVSSRIPPEHFPVRLS